MKNENKIDEQECKSPQGKNLCHKASKAEEEDFNEETRRAEDEDVMPELDSGTNHSRKKNGKGRSAA